MTTCEKILRTALKEFNRRGIEQVSIRDIAAAMGISDGNLRYHFRTRDDLVVALFRQLADKIGAAIEIDPGTAPDLKLMRNMLQIMLGSFYEYRFMMQDLVAVMNNHETIRKEFNRLTRERLAIMDMVIKQLVDLGYLIPEPQRGQYRRLMENFLILTHFWINGSRLFYKGKKKDMIPHYTETIFSLLHPYVKVKRKN